MKVFSKGKVLTIPNALTAFRIVLLPFFVWTYLTAKTESEYYVSLIILGVSGLTDLFDGFIARHFNQVSDVGKFLDPVADKLNQASILIALSFKYPIMLLPFGIMFVKEVYLGILMLIVIRRSGTVFGANWHGRWLRF